MNLLATTTISVLRGSTVNDLDDEVDGTVPVYSKVPASIFEQAPIIQTTPEGTPRTIRRFVTRLPARISLRDEDRIKDERTGDIYIIDAIVKSQNPVFTPDRRVNLRRVGDTN